MNAKYLLSGVLLLAAIGTSFNAMAGPSAHPQSAPAPAPPDTQSGKKSKAATHDAQHQDEGQRIFDQNCSRCHNAPDGFSSRISGTVVRHMRVRASLSQHDEQELLRFLNP